MTNLDIINEEIEALERKEINYAVAEKLANLYIVRDHMTNQEVEPVTVKTELESRSEFLTVVSSIPSDTAWDIMDELMTTLQTVNPRLYDCVMRKLKSS